MRIDGEILRFFKNENLYDEKTFKYIDSQCEYVDYYDDLQNFHIGYGPRNNNPMHILEGISLCIPYPVDAFTKIYDVHEITHAIVACRYLNRRYKEGITVEALPFLYEKLFIIQSNNKKYELCGEYLDSLYDENSDVYKFAFFARPYLLEAYDKNIDHMEQLSKKLVKKYNKTIK